MHRFSPLSRPKSPIEFRAVVRRNRTEAPESRQLAGISRSGARNERGALIIRAPRVIRPMRLFRLVEGHQGRHGTGPLHLGGGRRVPRDVRTDDEVANVVEEEWTGYVADQNL